MSSDENKESTQDNQESSEQSSSAGDTVDQVVKETEKAAENIQKTAGNFLASALTLQKEKPKLFYGAVGGLALLFLIALFSGGGDSSSPAVTGTAIKDLVIGQKYILEGPNAYDKNATIRLVAVPGTIAAYDDTDEEDRMGNCKHMPAGTPVSILSFQDAYGKKNAFSNVQIESEGECKGHTGWTLSINIK